MTKVSVYRFKLESEIERGKLAALNTLLKSFIVKGVLPVKSGFFSAHAKIKQQSKI
jgi:hypothetical protein